MEHPLLLFFVLRITGSGWKAWAHLLAAGRLFFMEGQCGRWRLLNKKELPLDAYLSILHVGLKQRYVVNTDGCCSDGVNHQVVFVSRQATVNVPALSARIIERGIQESDDSIGSNIQVLQVSI